MRTSFNRIYSCLATVLVVATLPANVLAISDGGSDDGQSSSKIQEIADVKKQKEAEQTAKLTELCSKFVNSKMSSEVESKRSQLESKLSEKGAELTGKRSEWDSKRDEARTLADSKRQNHYTKMLEMATGDNQKAAIAEFQIAVEDAVNSRRDAQDEARQAYRDGVDAALEDRKDELESTASEFRQAVDSAVAKAKTSCLNGTPIDSVKSTLKIDLDAAKSELKNAQSQITSASDIVKSLAETRKKTIETAKAVFEEALETAKAKLNTSLES